MIYSRCKYIGKSTDKYKLIKKRTGAHILNVWKRYIPHAIDEVLRILYTRRERNLLHSEKVSHGWAIGLGAGVAAWKTVAPIDKRLQTVLSSIGFSRNRHTDKPVKRHQRLRPRAGGRFIMMMLSESVCSPSTAPGAAKRPIRVVFWRFLFTAQG